MFTTVATRADERSISNQTNRNGDKRHDYSNRSTHSGERLVGFPAPGNCRDSPRFHAPHGARSHAGVTRDISRFLPDRERRPFLCADVCRSLRPVDLPF
jgi:hypothetical protein